MTQQLPYQHACWQCPHISLNAIEAYRHWLDHERSRRPELQPIVGKGERISVVLRDGSTFTDVVTDYQIDRETGEHTITVGNPNASAALEHIVAMGNRAVETLGLDKLLPDE